MQLEARQAVLLKQLGDQVLLRDVHLRVYQRHISVLAREGTSIVAAQHGCTCTTRTSNRRLNSRRDASFIYWCIKYILTFSSRV